MSACVCVLIAEQRCAERKWKNKIAVTLLIISKKAGKTKKVAIAKPSYDFTNWGQRGHGEGLAEEEEGNERCFMVLSCRQTEP